jgi:hypothetical protein
MDYLRLILLIYGKKFIKRETSAKVYQRGTHTNSCSLFRRKRVYKMVKYVDERV